MLKSSLKFLLQGIGTPGIDIDITDVITDSRRVVQGCLFVATKGERTDTHDLLPQIFEDGAVFAVVEHLVDGIPQEKQLVVKNTLEALISIGANYRNCYSPLMAGITGSMGKTTTKEFAFAAISQFGKTLKNEGNKNTEYGMTETLLKLDESYEYAIIEMGMSAPGDISLLAKAARPSIALITNIAHVHIRALGTLENILKAKFEIFDGLDKGSTIVLNKDDELLKTALIREDLQVVWYALDDKTADVTATLLETKGYGQVFKIEDKQFGTFEAYIPTLGTHTMQDALGAYTLVSRMGFPAEEVTKGLADYTPAGQRQKIVNHNGITVIEDCYNANVKSMCAGIGTLAQVPCAGKRIAVLGDMLELGEFAESMHEEVGRIVAEYSINLLYTFGEEAANIHKATKKSSEAKCGHSVECYHFTSKKELAEALKEIAKPEDAILFKASRGMEFEEIIAWFYEE